jgi:hypothetical protein
MARKDGKKIKGVDAFFRMASLTVAENRVNAQNFYTQELLTRPMDEYIAEKAAQGIDYTYRDIAIAALVRVFYLRPRLNRFIVKGNFYQRYHNDVSRAIQKNLRDGNQETVVKCRFKRKETLAEVKEKLDTTIYNAVNNENATDAFVGGILSKLPTWLLRLFVKFLRTADRWGWLSDKFWFTVSPFHASVLFADMKSVHLGPVWHHCYNLGNCGFMCCMGKEKLRAVVDPKTLEIRPEKVIELGITEDERFIDGLTYSHVIKTIERIMENLSVLERAPEDDEVRRPAPTPYEKKMAEKAERRAAKRHKKLHYS